ncbi:polyhydroxyalkanoate granule-associated phasin [Variovorax sp. ZT4R33]|uniref:polyhydroxyalkanoate granule-associated phasin n=1 Tax=Variovorax sp. ZT4R33 TaxID=3443743 RepID=UPI003F47CBF6
MSPSFSSRFFNPLMLWADVALKTQEMLLSSGSVIQHRTERMAKAGLAPTPADLVEFQLMGHEKLAAVSESGAAIANQLHTTGYSLLNRSLRHWLSGASAWAGLATSLTPAQAAAHSHALFSAGHQAVATATQLGSAGARVAQRGLKPIHAKATANARRLGTPSGA